MSNIISEVRIENRVPVLVTANGKPTILVLSGDNQKSADEFVKYVERVLADALSYDDLVRSLRAEGLPVIRPEVVTASWSAAKPGPISTMYANMTGKTIITETATDDPPGPTDGASTYYRMDVAEKTLNVLVAAGMVSRDDVERAKNFLSY